MDSSLRARLEAFVRPLYQDLDGSSRFEEVERVARIARNFHPPTRELELLLLFQALGTWLERVGNISRTLLAVGGDLSEGELRRIAASARRLDSPETDVEKAVAAAIAIDHGGVRGLAERLARSRREGNSIADVVRDVLASSFIPSWMPEAAKPWLAQRHESRREMCRRILEED